ncbi:MAG: hypothetical protein WCY25_08225 [Moheibacter sp.]
MSFQGHRDAEWNEEFVAGQRIPHFLYPSFQTDINPSIFPFCKIVLLIWKNRPADLEKSPCRFGEIILPIWGNQQVDLERAS